MTPLHESFGRQQTEAERGRVSCASLHCYCSLQPHIFFLFSPSSHLLSIFSIGFFWLESRRLSNGTRQGHFSETPSAGRSGVTSLIFLGNRTVNRLKGLDQCAGVSSGFALGVRTLEWKVSTQDRTEDGGVL